MSSEARSSHLAVLIDAENTSAKIAKALFDEIAKIGKASVRRVYGDFSNSRLKGWDDVLSKHAIIPQHQSSCAVGKNASDIALVIDAMDLLFSSRVDGFCLVSSDSDFTRLATRIREQGIDVYGFGEGKTPESFRQACRRFIYTENLLRKSMNASDIEPSIKSDHSTLSATLILKKTVSQIDSEDGWVNLSDVGKRLRTLYPDIDLRTYGRGKLNDLVRDTGAFDVEKAENGILRIRIKRATTNKAHNVNSTTAQTPLSPALKRLPLAT